MWFQRQMKGTEIFYTVACLFVIFKTILYKMFAVCIKGLIETLFNKAIVYKMLLNQNSLSEHVWILLLCVCVVCLALVIDCKLFAIARLPGVLFVRLRIVREQHQRKKASVTNSTSYCFICICSCFLCILFFNYYIMHALGYYQSGEICEE